MPNDIVVIAVHVSELPEYANLTGRQKIAKIENHISILCEQFKQTHPGAVWIIAFPEYIVTERAVERAPVSAEIKNQFKQKMAELVKKYPNLRIIAGTISTFSHKSIEKAKEHFALYSQKNIAHFIKKEMEGEGMQFSRHMAHFQKVIEKEEAKIAQIQDINEKEKARNDKPIKVIRNTCYIFSPTGVERRDKSLPYHELSFNKESFVYRVGKEKKSMNPIVKIQDLKGEDISVGIEICLEHMSGFLSHIAQEQKASLPLIHFVISDLITLKSQHFFGLYVIQLDTLSAPKLITPHPSLISKSLPSVQLYSSELSFEKENKAPISLPPLYPFECQIVDLMAQCSANFSEKNPRKHYLEWVRKKFTEVAGYGCDEGIILFLDRLFKSPEKISFIKNNDDVLDYNKLLKSERCPTFILNKKNEIYYMDHFKKTFQKLHKPLLKEYFESKTIVYDDEIILAVENIIGFKINKMIDFLNEIYFIRSNPIQILKNDIDELLIKHIGDIRFHSNSGEIYRSDLAERHPFAKKAEEKARREIESGEQKHKVSSLSKDSSQLPSASLTLFSPSASRASNESEFSEHDLGQASNESEFSSGSRKRAGSGSS